MMTSCFSLIRNHKLNCGTWKARSGKESYKFKLHGMPLLWAIAKGSYTFKMRKGILLSMTLILRKNYRNLGVNTQNLLHMSALIKLKLKWLQLAGMACFTNSIIFSFDNDRVRYHIATLTHDEKIVAASDYEEGL